MTMMSPNAAQAYRRVELDARIEASSGVNLTLVCLEEAISALDQAILALERSPAVVPTDPVSRAHGIVVYLARSVDPDNPLHTAIKEFYGGLALKLAANMRCAAADEVASVRDDLADVLKAVSGWRNGQ